MGFLKNFINKINKKTIEPKSHISFNKIIDSKQHISYFDDNGNVVDKEKATNCIITVYDNNGKLIHCVHGGIDGNKKNN